MKLAVISFTRAGAAVCGRLVKRFRELGESCDGYVQQRFLDELQEQPGLCPVKEPVADWAGSRFAQVDGLIFVGAAGIAVRAIAPHLRGKLTDPAVVVVDEKARFAISLLSGHVGGANVLAGRVAEILGAVPVVTTASDVNGREAIDVWAQRHGLTVGDRVLAKETAAELLSGHPVGFYSDYAVEVPLPDGCVQGQLCARNIWVTASCRRPGADDMVSWFAADPAGILRLVPRVLTVGVGCRRGTPAAVIKEAVRQVFVEHQLDLRAVARLASIDRKRDEQGILELAAQLGVPFLTCSAAELSQAEGEYSSSEFVRQVTGIDNVCERAAVLGAGAGARLVVRKQIYREADSAVTVAVAASEYRIGMMEK